MLIPQLTVSRKKFEYSKVSDCFQNLIGIIRTRFIIALSLVTWCLVGCSQICVLCDDDSDSGLNHGAWQHGNDSFESTLWSILLGCLLWIAILKFLSRRH